DGGQALKAFEGLKSLSHAEDKP
ncbi:MAG: hypothetical protein FD126_3301, partial [Elusimicrobia bacterium]